VSSIMVACDILFPLLVLLFYFSCENPNNKDNKEYLLESSLKSFHQHINQIHHIKHL
jgi:hypothetical protein